jgi:hypothetical protein
MSQGKGYAPGLVSSEFSIAKNLWEYHDKQRREKNQLKRKMANQMVMSVMKGISAHDVAKKAEMKEMGVFEKEFDGTKVFQPTRQKGVWGMLGTKIKPIHKRMELSSEFQDRLDTDPAFREQWLESIQEGGSNASWWNEYYDRDMIKQKYHVGGYSNQPKHKPIGIEYDEESFEFDDSVVTNDPSQRQMNFYQWEGSDLGEMPFFENTSGEEIGANTFIDTDTGLVYKEGTDDYNPENAIGKINNQEQLDKFKNYNIELEKLMSTNQKTGNIYENTNPSTEGIFGGISPAALASTDSGYNNVINQINENVLNTTEAIDLAQTEQEGLNLVGDSLNKMFSPGQNLWTDMFSGIFS